MAAVVSCLNIILQQLRRQVSGNFINFDQICMLTSRVSFRLNCSRAKCSKQGSFDEAEGLGT